MSAEEVQAARDAARKQMEERLSSRKASYEAGSDVILPASEEKDVVFDRVKNLLLP